MPRPVSRGGGETQALFYLNLPFGAVKGAALPASYGFMLRQDMEIISGNPPQRIPLLDVRFNALGEQSYRMFGLETYRMRADGAASAPAEVNWWLVGGMAVVGVALIVDAEKEEEKQKGVVVGGGWY